jgi:hypothetical protein
MRNYNVPGPQWEQFKENEWGTWFLDSNLEVRFSSGKYRTWAKGIKYDFDDLETAQKFAESGVISRFGGSLV